METVITQLKDNALVALFILITALYLGGDNRAIRSELEEFRAEMAENNLSIRAEIAALRAEMVSNNQAIRAEMAEEFKAVRAEIANTNERIANTNERLARVETRLDSIEDRLYLDTVRPSM